MKSITCIILSASYKLGFNGKWLQHSTTNACGGQFGFHYTQTWGGRYCIQWGDAKTLDYAMTLPHAHLFLCSECSHGYTRSPGTHAWLQEHTLLTSFARAQVKRPHQQQRGHERFRGQWRLRWDKYILLDLCTLNQWRRGLALRNKYVPNPRNQAAE